MIWTSKIRVFVTGNENIIWLLFNQWWDLKVGRFWDLGTGRRGEGRGRWWDGETWGPPKSKELYFFSLIDADLYRWFMLIFFCEHLRRLVSAISAITFLFFSLIHPLLTTNNHQFPNYNQISNSNQQSLITIHQSTLLPKYHLQPPTPITILYSPFLRSPFLILLKSLFFWNFFYIISVLARKN